MLLPGMNTKFPARYGPRLGCKGGMPHDPVQVAQTERYIVQRCRLCGVRKNWIKAHKGRTDNQGYLAFNIRKFAQKWGVTKRVYLKVRDPDQLTIHI